MSINQLVLVSREKRTVRTASFLKTNVHTSLASSERTEQLVTGPITGRPFHETRVIQARSFEDSKDFNVEQVHERTGRLVYTHDVIYVSESSQIRSAHESET